jgi:hypothetical protein
VTGTGTISGTTHNVTGINVSGLGDGTLTVSVTLSAGSATSTQSDTVTKSTFTSCADLIASGLVLCLDAGNPASYPGSGTSWTDLSSIGGTAIASGGPVYSSASGSFNFDGASDYFRMTRTDLNGGTFAYGNITVSLWFRPSPLGSSGYNANNLITVEYSFELSVGNLGNGYSSLFGASNPWAWYGTATNPLRNGVWQLITFVHASTGRWLYVNGQQVFTAADSGTISTGGGGWPYLTLMGRMTGTSSPAEGDLSVVHMYNRALSVAEVQANFDTMKGRFGL